MAFADAIERLWRSNPAPTEEPGPPPKVQLDFEVHDRMQLEIRSSLHMPKKHATQGLELDAFFFLPPNLGIDPKTYVREKFYDDVTAHLRLTARARGLTRLLVDDPSNPLTKLREALDQLRKGAAIPAPPLVAHAQLFAYNQSIALGREVRRMKKRLKRVQKTRRSAKADAFEDQLNELLHATNETLWAFRRVRSGLWPFEPMLGTAVAEALWVADEFISLQVEDKLARLAQAIEEASSSLEPARAARLCASICDVIEDEYAHRRKYGYATLPSARADYGEYFLQRRSLLKKAVQRALYLDARQVQHDAFVKNSVGAVGAALAAIWAWTTQVPLMVERLSGQTKALFFFAAVAAYVAKDRIKAITNDYLPNKLRRYDHLWRIRSDILAPMGVGPLEARVEESVKHKKAHELDADVRAAFSPSEDLSTLLASTSREDVIHYKKVFLQNAKNASTLDLPKRYGVLDILRINMEEFVHKLDDPEETVVVYNASERRFAQVTLPRVYQLQVVLRARGVTSHGRSGERWGRFRVMLNKLGIVRVERS